jgi:hypothetical protein
VRRDDLIARLKWVGLNLDVLLPLAFAVAISAGEAFWTFGDRFIRIATISLLGLVSLTLLRERRSTSRIDELASFLAAHTSSQPYEVVEETVEWSMTDAGKHAICEKQALVCLTRDRVSCIEDWWIGDGRVTDYKTFWRRAGDASYVELKDAYSFPFKHGEKHLLCFDDERNRNELLDIKIRRVVEDGFTGSPDAISIQPWTLAKKLTMRIIWSEQKPPTSVEFRRDEHTQESVDASKLPRSASGRAEYSTTVRKVSAGETITISWTI